MNSFCRTEHALWSRIALLGIFIVTPAMGQTSHIVRDDSLQRSMAYVRGLSLDCTLADGYECAAIEEEDFLNPESWGRMIPAVYMPAWQVSYQDFQQIQDLSNEQKDLRHYKIGFTENEKQFIILLQGLLLPHIDKQGERNSITHTVFGRSTKYWVNKQTLSIDKRLFYK